MAVPHIAGSGQGVMSNLFFVEDRNVTFLLSMVLWRYIEPQRRVQCVFVSSVSVFALLLS